MLRDPLAAVQDVMHAGKRVPRVTHTQRCLTAPTCEYQSRDVGAGFKLSDKRFHQCLADALIREPETAMNHGSHFEIVTLSSNRLSMTYCALVALTFAAATVGVSIVRVLESPLRESWRAASNHQRYLSKPVIDNGHEILG